MAITNPFDQYYAEAAASVLEHCPGDFVAVGASAIPIIMHMAALDGSRSYTCVPFSGFWLWHDEWQDDSTRIFKRAEKLEPKHMPAYQQRLNGMGITPQIIASNRSRLNLIDLVQTGAGLTSFADVLIDDAENASLTSKVVANLNMIGVTDCLKSGSTDIYRWPGKAGKNRQLSQTNIKIDGSVVTRMFWDSAEAAALREPRLTAHYKPHDWRKSPKSAPAYNIQLFRDKAKALGVSHLFPA